MTQNSQLQLSEEEALRLLNLCLCSPGSLDAVAESAVIKLADYCRSADSGSARFELAG